MLVIEDFSASAVEALLRFLCSVVVEAKSETLVEVGGLADKYNIPRLQQLCTQGLEKELAIENACELFQVADRIGAAQIRKKCFDFILIKPKQALLKACMLSPDLLDEVLSSSLFSIRDGYLLAVILEWGSGQVAKNINVLSIIEQHVHLAVLSDDDFSKHLLAADSAGCTSALKIMRHNCKRGEYIEDVFQALWNYFEIQYQPKLEQRCDLPHFLGFWVNCIPSTADFC